MLERWETSRPERKVWIMWDIALVEAILWPDMATAKTTGAPIVHGVRKVEQFPDNPRRVTVWVDIDENSMLADFWRVLDQHAVRCVAQVRETIERRPDAVALHLVSGGANRLDDETPIGVA